MKRPYNSSVLILTLALRTQQKARRVCVFLRLGKGNALFGDGREQGRRVMVLARC